MSSYSLASAGAGGHSGVPSFPGALSHDVYNSFTHAVSNRTKIACIVGEMLQPKDLLRLEVTCKSTRQNFARFVCDENHGRHNLLVLHSKESLIFHNLFSPLSHRANTFQTLVALIRKGRAFDEASVVHQDLIPIAKKVVAKLKSGDWNISSDEDILAEPLALKIFAKKNFERLILNNPNNKAVFYAILPHYVESWNEGGDNNITSFLGESLLADEEVARSLLALEPHFFFDLSEDLQQIKELVILACQCETIEEVYVDPQMFLSRLDDKWLDDEDVMYTICARFGYAFVYASERLQDHKPLAMMAIDKDADAFKFASDRLKNDFDVVSLAMQKKFKNFLLAGIAIRSDIQMASFAFNLNPLSLRYILNRSFVLDVVSMDLSHFKIDNISPIFKADFDFMKMLCARNEEAIVESCVLDESFYSSREFALAVIPHNPHALRSLHPMCLIDLDLVSLACDKDPQVLKYITHKEIIMHVIKKNGLAALFINDEVRKDQAFMETAMSYI